jgi:hypothetical protein
METCLCFFPNFEWNDPETSQIFFGYKSILNQFVGSNKCMFCSLGFMSKMCFRGRKKAFCAFC